MKLEAFSDADWGSNNDGKSFTGYCLTLGGAVTSWQSRKQQCVALSSAEAEYVAISDTAKEVIFVKGLSNELLSKKVSPVIVYSDSQSAIKLVENNNFHKRNKHINIRYNFIKDLVKNREIKLEYCDTKHMPV